MQKIAIDVGYSHTKAMTSEGRVIIPSVVAPYREQALEVENKEYKTDIRYPGLDTKSYFVGELAEREGREQTFTLDAKKHLHENHNVLIMTASTALEMQPRATVVVGLPVTYFRSQKQDLEECLRSIEASVGIDNKHFGYVQFENVIVYPQGAGALMVAPDLPREGKVLLVDVGFKTTDLVTAEIVNGQVRPIGSLCTSFEIGVFNLQEIIRQAFQKRTGVPLIQNAAKTLITEGKIYHYGKLLDFGLEIQKAKQAVTQSIIDQVQNFMANQMASLRIVYLAGGGAIMLPELQRVYPITSVIPDPQWANVRGFLQVAS